jgi:N-acyl-D-aspartate/D-glutamate deacylase
MVTQGITTAIHGEGESSGPVNDRVLATETDTAMRRIVSRFNGPHGFGDWLDYMVARGTAQNVGSFLGDGTLRVYAKGEEGGPLTPAERDTARAVIARAGLATWSIEGGGDLMDLASELRTQSGVEMVVPFGNALHVSGTDAAALERSLQRYATRDDLAVRRVAPGLEDVFIHLMPR